jgi:hypothetical protein
MSSQASQITQYKDALKLMKKKCQSAENQCIGKGLCSLITLRDESEV